MKYLWVYCTSLYANICTNLGASFLSLCQQIGAFIFFTGEGVFYGLIPAFYLRYFIKTFTELIFYSLPIVALTAVFTAMVLALQSYSAVAQFNPLEVSSIVTMGMVREMGPVLTGLIVTGRVGAGLAAEIGSMRISNQIDALVTLGVNPFKYLVGPCIFAGLCAVPLLTAIADILGIFGGYLVGHFSFGLDTVLYLHQGFEALNAHDVIVGFSKAAIFGIILTTAGCYTGYTANSGASGVGKATTNAVVLSSLLILAFDFAITRFFFVR